MLIYAILYVIFYQFKLGYASSVYFLKETREAIGILLYFVFLDVIFSVLFIGRDARLYDLILSWAIVIGTLVLFRILYRQILVALGVRRPVVIYGTSANAVAVTKTLLTDRFMLIKIIGYVAPDKKQLSAEVLNQLATRRVMQVEEFFARENREKLANATVYIALDDNRGNLGPLVDRISENFDGCVVVPNLRGVPADYSHIHHVMGRDFIFIHLSVARTVFVRAMKRSLDVILAAAALIVFAPLLIIVAALIWSGDGAPIIYSQERIGRGIKPFKFYKFRSMVNNADTILAEWGEKNPDLYQAYVENNFKLAKDPRVTGVGAWIRRSSIDELPQLFNVLRGDMSIVGPRPILEREIDAYEGNLALYGRMRPGITGLWQVSGRSSTSFFDRATYDEWYVRNWSIWLDIVILFKTVRVVLMRNGAH
ncbi:undecaprenyl-phosphate galactose phosphotransferase WbaP [Aliidongia dinghuensis]|uniref:Undecaprenyl-phosphate galactose phosphotransferase WbaP n=2 Tax=Aliidongia dinghuensis TaxID=1867774 RepID=A0A8J3E4H2_9PROT|nr:undecaprenyl-phosphate galactose phosphotransferase WbaP [Aliidongia dinghuensis]